MREFYTFKLNLTHPVLNLYKSEKEEKQLFLSLIPEYLDTVLGKSELIKSYKKYSIAHTTGNLFPTENLVNKYDNLVKKTQIMDKIYQGLIKEFEKTGNIMYPAEYIKLNEECKKERNVIETEVEELESVYEDVRDYEVSKELNINRSLGIGVSHFFKMKKIEKYLAIIDIQFEFFYDPTKECFYFEKINTIQNKNDFTRIKTEANVLMDLLNSNINFTKKLGSITIIEQYEEIKLSETTTKVSIELVYPNASIENEITSELSNISREIGAQTLKIDVEGQNLNISNFEKLLTKEGLSGYISNVSSRGKSLVLKITNLFL